MEVYKFGGLSIKDADSVKNVAEIIQQYKGDRLVVVCSAMGKMTRLLGNIIQAYHKRSQDRKILLKEFTDYHIGIINELNMRQDYRSEVLNLISQLEKSLNNTAKRNFSFYYDQSVCYGELISSKIVSLYLRQDGLNNAWLDVRDMIITDNAYRKGKVDWSVTPGLVKYIYEENSSHKLLITQGFIGKSQDGHSISLGFEGSDYTAAILANSLDAEKVTIWKDVEGVMNCDPKIFPGAVKIDKMSFSDAAELALMGAKVIHPSTIKPLQIKNIPLEVRSCIYPERSGTLVSKNGSQDSVPMFTVRNHQCLMRAENNMGGDPKGNANHVSQLLNNDQLKVNFVYPDIRGFWFTMDYHPYLVDRLHDQLSADFNVNRLDEVEILSIIYPDQDTVNRLTAGKEIFIEVRNKDKTVFIIKQDTL